MDGVTNCYDMSALLCREQNFGRMGGSYSVAMPWRHCAKGHSNWQSFSGSISEVLFVNAPLFAARFRVLADFCVVHHLMALTRVTVNACSSSMDFMIAHRVLFASRLMTKIILCVIIFCAKKTRPKGQKKKSTRGPPRAATVSWIVIV